MQHIDQTTSLYLNNEVQFFCFQLEEEGEIYGTNIFKVREVIQYDAILSETEGGNLGVMVGFMSVRGETIPLLDLRRWIYAETGGAPDQDLQDASIRSPKIVAAICEFSNFVVGIRIYAARRIISRRWDEVVQASDQGIIGGKITATTKYSPTQLLQIVDVEQMLVEIFPFLEAKREDELSELEEMESQKLVLLAEDSPSAMKIMQKTLERLGIRYRAFWNGKELLDYLEESTENIEEIGAIITDLEMPNVSGFEVIKRLRAQKETAKLPIIVNSSMSGDSNRDMAIKLNADDFISKSNPKEIEAALKRFI